MGLQAGQTVRALCIANGARFVEGTVTSYRGIELYDNTFLFDDLGDDTLNPCRWIWIRGGTGIITDNAMPDLKSQMWGDGDEIQIIVMSLRRECLYAGWPYPVPAPETTPNS